jgi:hypothetical protein
MLACLLFGIHMWTYANIPCTCSLGLGRLVANMSIKLKESKNMGIFDCSARLQKLVEISL